MPGISEVEYESNNDGPNERFLPPRILVIPSARSALPLTGPAF